MFKTGSEKMNDTKPFDTALYAVPPRLRKILENLPDFIKSEVQEIRIRSGMPFALTMSGKPVFVLKDGNVSKNSKFSAICDSTDTKECLMLLTNHSVYAHTNEISEGFIRMRCGHRAGICGTFSENGMIYDISGINIRIARQVIGVSDEICDKIYGGLLILGSPGSGKTTMLRDLIRQKSILGKKISVIDSRGEISASSYGINQYNLGDNTDVYIISDKAHGIEMSLRTLYPDIIAFDEIGNMREFNAVNECFNSGIDIFTTAHIGNLTDIKNRKVVKSLLLSNAIETVIMMPRIIGGEIKTYNVGEILNDYNF